MQIASFRRKLTCSGLSWHALETSPCSDLLQVGHRGCSVCWRACILTVAARVLILGSAPHSQPRPARCWRCRNALARADAAWQHRHLAQHGTARSNQAVIYQRAGCQQQTGVHRPLTRIITPTDAWHFSAFLQRYTPCKMSELTSASQLAARKNGVEKRSLLLTTL